MNDVLCIYYSRTGKTKAAMEEIAGALDAELVELRDGVAYNQYGENVDAAFRAGVQKALEQIEGQQIDLVVLQSRSPTCGVKQIYDGTFSKRLIDGQGMLAAALAESGYRLVDVEDIDSVPEL